MSSSNTLIFKLRHRYGECEKPVDLYNSAYSKLIELPPPWGLQGKAQLLMKEIPGAHAFGVNYRKVEKTSPVKSFVFGFMNRRRTALPEDESINDDILMIEFYRRKVVEEWAYLMDVVFPCYVQATGAYCGALYDGEIHVNDVVKVEAETGESIINSAFVDWRAGIYRIWQANYWDHQLCHRSFNLKPEEIVERLRGNVAKCEIFQEGVILICSYEPVFGDEILKLNDLILPLLHG